MKRYGIWLFVLMGAVLVVWLLHCFAFSSYLILSSDMKNTLLPGERIIVNKWSYGLRAPYISFFGYHRWNERPVRRGDVAVFNNPMDWSEKVVDKRKIFISRCMGLPGDTLLVDSLFRTYNSSNAENSTAERRGVYRLVIPRQGCRITVDPINRVLLCNTLRLHEKKQATIRHDTLFVDGHPVQSCIFQRNYYWMVSNAANPMSDSRLFGFVPADHLVGQASFIWFSKDNRMNLFYGYRWNRFFRSVK
jgi:signal peptidase I